MHLDERNFEVESLEKATLKVHQVYTVVNDEGRDALLFSAHSTKYCSLDQAEIRVYDGNGRQVDKFKKKDMTTYAVGEGLIEEGYRTSYRIKPASYPVTLEVIYEQKFRGTLFIPAFHFIGAKEAVIQSSYTVKVPTEIGLRYKAVHTSITPVVSTDGKNTMYKWTVNNLPAFENEEGSVAAMDQFQCVKMVANQFSYYGFRGDFSSWQSFGAWMGGLYKGLDELPTDQQQYLKNLVSNVPTEREKVQLIYGYLQHNFRYVSIQLGIGGFRPFSAAFTSEKKYGDCKGLSNYMRAALKAVGIKSYVALINADEDEPSAPVDPDFPIDAFNHVILCVPGAKDSIWLECTSNSAEFGKLGPSTENRNALLITENGGVLVPTPRSQASANFMSTTTAVSVLDDLSAATETMMQTRGVYSGIMSTVLKEKHDDQKRILVNYLGYKQPDVFEFASSNTAESQQAGLKMEVRKLPEFNSGNNYFIKPRINKMWSQKLPAAANRKMDYYFHFPFQKHDTTVLKLPANYKATVLPKEQELRTGYSYYKSKSWYNADENAVYTATTLTLKQHKIPAADYASVKSFFDAVLQDDTQRIVVAKTGESTEIKAF